MLCKMPQGHVQLSQNAGAGLADSAAVDIKIYVPLKAVSQGKLAFEFGQCMSSVQAVQWATAVQDDCYGSYQAPAGRCLH